MKTCRLLAHRGLSSRAPENTFAAFQETLDRGLTWIETDVDILGDGTPILIHDSTLDRTTNRSGSYYDLTANDLAAIDAGSWFSREFAGERIPTLAQLVDFMNRTGLNANIEIKSNEQGNAQTLTLIDNVIAEIERLRPGCQVIVSSFNHLLLYIFKQRAPKLPVGCLYETTALDDDWRSILELVGAEYIQPEGSSLTKERVDAFHDAGYGINVWTVDDPARANQLVNWGVDGVVSNVADQLMGIARAAVN